MPSKSSLQARLETYRAISLADVAAKNFCQRHALGVELTPADARRFALLGRHLLPAMIVLQHVLTFGGRKLLELMKALENLLALLGGSCLKCA